jgi:hypothetical protein
VQATQQPFLGCVIDATYQHRAVVEPRLQFMCVHINILGFF